MTESTRAPAGATRAEYREDERGVITAMFVVVSLFLFAIVSIVAEGGRKLANVGRAEDVAAEAARAAAATLDLELISRGRAEINSVDGRAEEQALKILAEVDGALIEDIEVSADSVFVRVRVTGDSWIPGFNIDGVGTHTAAALDPFDAEP